MITEINSAVSGNRITSANNISGIAFKSKDKEQTDEINDLKFMPDFRDIVVERDSYDKGIFDFIQNVNKDIELSQAQLKIDMLKEKFDNIKEDGLKKDLLGWMIADAIDEKKTVELHYNVK